MAKKIDLAEGLTHFKAKENASIAITEATSTASAPHKAGEYFYYKGDLVIATADIAQGGTITLNTNCKKQPLADSVCELKTALTFQNVKGKNIYDNSNPTIVDGFIGTSGMQPYQTKFSSSPAAKCLVIPIESSTQYTASTKKNYGRFAYGLFESIPSNADIGYYPTVTLVSDSERSGFTITTGADSKYLVLYYWNANDGIAEADIRGYIMLTKDGTYTPYEAYSAESKLKVIKLNLNNNGTAGQFLKLGSNGSDLEWDNPPATLDLDDTLTQQGDAADAKATGDAIAAAVDDLETQLGQVVVASGVEEWLNDHPEAMVVIKVNGDADDAPTLGEELLSSSGWTTTGWTGDFANGFTHTTGNTNALSCEINSLEEGSLYQFQITTSNAATNGYSDFYVSLGGSDLFETYRGGGTSVSYTYGIFCGSTKVLSITPRSGYTGTVTGLSLKKVTNTVGANYEIADSDGNITYEIRTVKAARNAIYQGDGSGEKSFWGYENVAVGDSALENNTGGFWNTAIGYRALRSNQNGSRNVAIGYIALRANTGGDRNVAIGTFALEDNTTGRGNIAINADAEQNNTTGNYNIGIGVRALVANSTGSNNIAIGYNALAEATGSNNIAIGNNADVPTASGSNQMVLGNSNITTVVIAGKTINFNQDGTVTWS